MMTVEMLLMTILSSRFTPHSIEDILGREERQTILGREKNHFVLGRGEDHSLGRKNDHSLLGRGEDHSILGRGEKRGREEVAVQHNKVEKKLKTDFFSLKLTD